MKRKWYLALLLVLCLSVSTSVYAIDQVGGNDVLKPEISPVKELYMLTKSCPDGYKAYVATNIEEFLLSVEEEDLPEDGTITVGVPFCFGNYGSDIFYFPILCNSEIVYTLRVFPVGSGEYSGILGKNYVKDLNLYAMKSSIERPLEIVMENNVVVAYIGDEREVIFEFPIENASNENQSILMETISVALQNNEERSVINIMERCDEVSQSIAISELNANRNIENTRNVNIPTYKYLTLRLTEFQDELPWCAGYATAAIIRYVKGNNDNTTAYDIMNHFFDNPNINCSIGEDEVVEYANSRGIYPTLLRNALLNTELIREIAEDSPVYLRMRRSENGDHYHHAIVLRGYSQTTAKWSIWNPWYDYYESLDFGATYVPAEDTAKQYTYVHTVYNWR